MTSDFFASLFIYGTIFVLFVLLIVSLFVKDYTYIVENTTDFVFEMIMFALVAAILITWVFYETRGLSKEVAFWLFISVFIKLALFHLFLQLSGVYTSFFKK